VNVHYLQRFTQPAHCRHSLSRTNFDDSELSVAYLMGKFDEFSLLFLFAVGEEGLSPTNIVIIRTHE
jgi:hypothetical protein